MKVTLFPLFWGGKRVKHGSKGVITYPSPGKSPYRHHFGGKGHFGGLADVKVAILTISEMFLILGEKRGKNGVQNCSKRVHLRSNHRGIALGAKVTFGVKTM